MTSSTLSIRDSAIGATGKEPSRGAFACLQLLRRFFKAYGPDGCYPGQEYITSELRRILKRPTLGLRTVKRWIGELKDLKAIKVTQHRRRSSNYSVLWVDCKTWQSFVELAAKNGTSRIEITDQRLAGENGTPSGTSNGTSRGGPSLSNSPSGVLNPSGVELGFEQSPREQRHSPLVNDVVSEKSSPEGKDQNQDAAVAEVWEVVKARAVVVPSITLTQANRVTIGEMLDQGGVDFAKQLIFRGSLRKLAARLNRGDQSPIVSPRYFLALADEVNRDGTELSDISRRAYWRHIEQRLISEERKLTAARSSQGSASHPFEQRDVA